MTALPSKVLAIERSIAALYRERQWARFWPSQFAEDISIEEAAEALMVLSMAGKLVATAEIIADDDDGSVLWCGDPVDARNILALAPAQLPWHGRYWADPQVAGIKLRFELTPDWKSDLQDKKKALTTPRRR